MPLKKVAYSFEMTLPARDNSYLSDKDSWTPFPSSLDALTLWVCVPYFPVPVCLLFTEKRCTVFTLCQAIYLFIHFSLCVCFDLACPLTFLFAVVSDPVSAWPHLQIVFWIYLLNKLQLSPAHFMTPSGS